MREAEDEPVDVVAAEELHEEADDAVAREVAGEDPAVGDVAAAEERDEPGREDHQRRRLVELRRMDPHPARAERPRVVVDDGEERSGRRPVAAAGEKAADPGQRLRRGPAGASTSSTASTGAPASRRYTSAAIPPPRKPP